MVVSRKGFIVQQGSIKILEIGKSRNNALGVVGWGWCLEKSLKEPEKIQFVHKLNK